MPSVAEVRLTPGAQEQFVALPLPIQARVQTVIARLAGWPRVSGAKPLRGELAGQYRVRTGDYRVQFRPVGDTVIVGKIGHRDGFYDE
jgi:mRNA-degrading endonuclease RelE of RelBE toxin-antitoxin system